MDRIRLFKPSDVAWVVLGVGVVSYDVLCAEGFTLSERVDEWLTTHPVTTRVVVLTLALHLINALPPRVDPVHLAFTSLRLRKSSVKWGRVTVAVRRINR